MGQCYKLELSAGQLGLFSVSLGRVSFRTYCTEWLCLRVRIRFSPWNAYFDEIRRDGGSFVRVDGMGGITVNISIIGRRFYDGSYIRTLVAPLPVRAHGIYFSAKVGFNSTRFVFRLTLVQTKSPQFALVASLAAAIGTSPATWLIGSYTEIFYTFFTIRGIIYCEGRKWLPAAIAFGLATLFRANGILLSGFLVWYMIVLPYLRNKVRSWRLL